MNRVVGQDIFGRGRLICLGMQRSRWGFELEELRKKARREAAAEGISGSWDCSREGN
jgi:hypothetical protein